MRHPAPAGCAGVNYWAVHACIPTTGKGPTTTLKPKAVPTEGEAGLRDDEAKARCCVAPDKRAPLRGRKR